MALNLDARQRAMLQDMGITLWLPQPVAVTPVQPTPVSAEAVVAASTATVVPLSLSQTAVPSPRAEPPRAAPAPVTVVRSQVSAATEAQTAVPLPTAPTSWRMAPPVRVYPDASSDADTLPWLIIWEGLDPTQPLVGDAGRLLDNMLRALRLHRRGTVWVSALQRPGSEALTITGLPTAQVAWEPLESGLRTTLTQTAPGRVLLLGLHAARAVLGSTEALGRLRAQLHTVCGTPTLVSYDPAYLLRSPHAKPAAWADLCRAHALRPPARH